jgi:hypothetical protein
MTNPTWNPPCLLILESSLWFMLPITFLAIDGPLAIGFKRDLGFLSAICTSYSMHFSRRSIISSASFLIHLYLPIYRVFMKKTLKLKNIYPLFNLIGNEITIYIIQ